jgi:hypothetical protein
MTQVVILGSWGEDSRSGEVVDLDVGRVNDLVTREHDTNNPARLRLPGTAVTYPNSHLEDRVNRNLAGHGDWPRKQVGPEAGIGLSRAA